MIDTLNLAFSDYLPQSELNRLCATAGKNEWVPVSPELFSILQKAKRANAISKGSFDITLSPVIRLWRTARRKQQLPPKDSIALAMKKVGNKYILLDAKTRSVKLTRVNMQLDLGGIAKGETAQKCIVRLKELGFPFALADAGGDIVAGGTPEDLPGWKVAINLPESEELMDRQLILRNKAVTTSGDLYQYLVVNGVRYSHIIDPLTGWALTNSRNVTVIADSGADADWLTKACSILPINKALKLVKKFKGAEVQITTLEHDQPVFYRSARFALYFR